MITGPFRPRPRLLAYYQAFSYLGEVFFELFDVDFEH
jgi:hypothetical protein